jgi:hypothetical protein
MLCLRNIENAMARVNKNGIRLKENWMIENCFIREKKQKEIRPARRSGTIIK